MKSQSTLIDAGQEETRTLVEQLHAHADTCEQVARQSKLDDTYNPIFWETLAAALTDAACTLDDYQAGLRIATPNPRTGLELCDVTATNGVPTLGCGYGVLQPQSSEDPEFWRAA